MSAELDEIKKLIVKVAVLTDRFDERGDKIVQSNMQAAQHINQTAQNTATTSQRVEQQAVDNFRQVAGKALIDGMREPIKDCDKTLQSSAYKVQSMTDKLEKSLSAVQKLLVVNMWKTTAASIVAIVAALIVWFVVGKNINQDIKRSEWIGFINSAMDINKMVACPEGGLCANINGKLTRLDK